MAHTFLNISFEDAGASPMDPDNWTSSITATAEDFAAFDALAPVLADPPEPFEDYREGWADEAAQAAIVSGIAETYNLVDGETLDVSVDGGAPATATFNIADFGDITAATAAEVAVVLNTDIAGATASDVAGQVQIESDTAGLGSEIQVTGGTAATKFGFQAESVLIDGNQDYLFAFAETDLGDAAFDQPPSEEDFEDYEEQWAFFGAFVENSVKEPYAFPPSDLDISVDGGVDQTIIIVAETTAQEVVDTINGTPLIGATAIVRRGFVRIINDNTLPNNSIRVTGGLANSVLLFDTDLHTIKGNEFALTELSSSSFAAFDVGTPENFEDYEEEWPDNESFIWFFTTRSILFETAAEGTWTVRIVSNQGDDETFTFVATDVSTVDDIAAAFNTDINANSNVATATDAGGGLLEINVIDNRVQLVFTLTAPELGSVVETTALAAGTLDEAAFDVGVPEDFEDYEEEWTGLATYLFTFVGIGTDLEAAEFEPFEDFEDYEETVTHSHSLVVNVAQAGIYLIRIDGIDYTFLATGGDTTTTIAIGLAASVSGSAAKWGATGQAGTQVLLRPDTGPGGGINESNMPGISAGAPSGSDVSLAENPSADAFWTPWATMRTL